MARDETTANNLGLVEQRVERLGLGGVYHAGLDAKDLAERNHSRDFSQALRRARDLQRPVLLEAGVLSCFVLQGGK